MLRLSFYLSLLTIVFFPYTVSKVNFRSDLVPMLYFSTLDLSKTLQVHIEFLV